MPAKIAFFLSVAAGYMRGNVCISPTGCGYLRGMRSNTETEENYLKALFHLTKNGESASTNAIAGSLNTSAASVTDMIKRLNEKQLVEHIPYRGTSLTPAGRAIAVSIIRKHRLWEVFLVEKLGFSWDHVHVVAEQLEHVESEELIKRLDLFLESPRFDPHGDPIPDEDGTIYERVTKLLAEVPAGETVEVASVATDESNFLQYIDRIGLSIGQKITVTERLSFDESLQLQVGNMQVVISGKVAHSIRVLA